MHFIKDYVSTGCMVTKQIPTVNWQGLFHVWSCLQWALYTQTTQHDQIVYYITKLGYMAGNKIY